MYRRLQASSAQTQYNKTESASIHDDFHQIITLAFLPVQDIEDTFDGLCDTADPRLQPVLQHVHDHYIHGTFITLGKKKIAQAFPPNTWNCYERALGGWPYTINTCEAWHSKLSHLL